MLSILWALIPTRYLYGAAAIAALLLGGVFAFRQTYRRGANRGYARARDSVWLAETKHKQVLLDSMEHRADSLVTLAQQGSTVLAAAKQHFDSAPRHTPRIEALTVPVTVDTTLVGVTVESTHEHFILPRAAARYWYVSDSLVGVAQQLLAKYAAANAQWRDAWLSEHEAREGADSLVAMYAERLRSVAPQVQGHSRRWPYLVAGAVVGFIAAKRVH